MDNKDVNTGEQPQNSINEQFKQGAPDRANVPPQLTPEQIEEEKDRLTKVMKADIAFWRLKVEYDDLQIKAIEQDVRLGRRPVNSVHGLLGTELMSKDIQMRGYLTEWANHAQQQINDQLEMQQMEQKMKENKEQSEEAGATQN